MATSQLSWYVTRGAGFLALLALTGSVLLGILSAQRWSPASDAKVRWAALHQNLALLGLVGLVIHIVTAIADPFTHLGLTTAFDPLHRSYRPLWLGLGIVASDLFLAIIITSLLRHKLGFRSWKFVHLGSYMVWVLAMFHGLATGSDTQFLGFDLIYFSCLAAVTVAIWTRMLTRFRGPNGVKLSLYAVTAALPALLIGWSLDGPIKSSWARQFSAAPASVRLPVAKPVQVSWSPLALSGSVYGVTQSIPGGGFAIAGRFTAKPSVVFQVDYLGTVSGASTTVTKTLVSVGTDASPRLFTGTATYFTPNFVAAQLKDAAGRSIYIQLDIGRSTTSKLFGAGLLTSAVQQLPVLPPPLPQKVVTIVEKVPVVQQVPVYINSSSGGSGGDN